MAPPTFRLLDTGINDGRWNVALDQVLIDAHRAGQAPDTLRFLRFTPSVLVGRHQDLSREIDVDYCARHGIDVGRRVTGGGALYLDPQQLGWELVCTRAALGGGSLGKLAERICSAAAAGLSRLGIDARFRPRNDIEVDGRKIGGTGGFFDGDTLFYQGTVLGEVDTEVMFRALRVPGAKRARHAGAAPAARVTSLAEACGGRAPAALAVMAALTAGFCDAFGIEVAEGMLDEREARAVAASYRDDIGSAAFVHDIDQPGAGDGILSATRDTAGGLVEVHLKLAGKPPRIASIVISGDFFVTPPRVVFDLESALRDTPLAALEANVAAFLASAGVQTLSLAADDLIGAIRAAAERDG
ncbi:MAG: lipoate--protein ligase family protein [Gammaproteobacteria bacterium]